MRVLRAWLTPWDEVYLSPEPCKGGTSAVNITLLQGFVFADFVSPGVVPRLRRFALPWAGL